MLTQLAKILIKRCTIQIPAHSHTLSLYAFLVECHWKQQPRKLYLFLCVCIYISKCIKRIKIEWSSVKLLVKCSFLVVKYSLRSVCLSTFLSLSSVYLKLLAVRFFYSLSLVETFRSMKSEKWLSGIVRQKKCALSFVCVIVQIDLYIDRLDPYKFYNF